MKLKRRTAVQWRALWNIPIWYDSQVANEIRLEKSVSIDPCIHCHTVSIKYEDTDVGILLAYITDTHFISVLTCFLFLKNFNSMTYIE